MEKNGQKETQTQPSRTSNPKDSSLPDASDPPPSYVQPIPIPARPQQPTQSPYPSERPFRPHPRYASTSSIGRAEEAITQQQEMADNVQRGFHPSLVHRPPTPKPAYADFGGRWVSKDEDGKGKGGMRPPRAEARRMGSKGPAEHDDDEDID